MSGNTFDGVDIGILVANGSGTSASQATRSRTSPAASEIAGGSFGTGIALFNPTFTHGLVTISGNTFKDSDTGIRTSTDGSGSFTLSDANVSISGNTFTNNLYHIVDKFTGELNLGGSNIFDGVTLSSATTADLDIADKVVDRVDVAAYGLLRLKAGNVTSPPRASLLRADDAGEHPARRGRGGNRRDGECRCGRVYRAARHGHQDHVDPRSAEWRGRRIAPELNRSSMAQASPTSIFRRTMLPSTASPSRARPAATSSAAAWSFNPARMGDIANNIIQGNYGGVIIANNSPTDALIIENNLFRDNNGGLATDIYGDQFSSGAGTKNVTIRNNTFTNSAFAEDHWAIGVSNTAATPFSNFSISGNDFSQSGRAMYFFNASDVSITANTVTGANHYDNRPVRRYRYQLHHRTEHASGRARGIDVFNELSGTTDATGLSIHNNFVQDNTGVGIWIETGTIVTTGSIQVHSNSISGNDSAGLENDFAAVDAINNWWGDETGPTNAANPSGTGHAIVGANVSFEPWLDERRG